MTRRWPGRRHDLRLCQVPVRCDGVWGGAHLTGSAWIRHPSCGPVPSPCGDWAPGCEHGIIRAVEPGEALLGGLLIAAVLWDVFQTVVGAPAVAGSVPDRPKPDALLLADHTRRGPAYRRPTTSRRPDRRLRAVPRAAAPGGLGGEPAPRVRAPLLRPARRAAALPANATGGDLCRRDGALHHRLRRLRIPGAPARAHGAALMAAGTGLGMWRSL